MDARTMLIEALCRDGVYRVPDVIERFLALGAERERIRFVVSREE